MATRDELYSQLNELWEQFQENHRAHSEKGNKAAGTRVRKAMQQIKTLAQDVRVAVSAANNA